MPPLPASVPPELAAFWSASRQRIDARLEQLVPAAETPPAVLSRAMGYTLLAPGKRIRGVLLLAAVELLRGVPERGLAPACAVEMIHAASLILDDLPSMDAASLRRGRPVLHRVVGEANAILAAVALLNAGFETLHRADDLRERVRVALARRLHHAVGAAGLVGGQVVDLESTGRSLDLDALELVHRKKTGALFTAAAEMGALVAGGRERDLTALRRYAKNLGLAFQITDDLLDAAGEPGTTGKDAGLDRQKTTFVRLCGMDGARRLAGELLDTATVALQPFGRRGTRLAELAEFVRSRDR